MSAAFSGLTNIEVDRPNETVSQTVLGERDLCHQIPVKRPANCAFLLTKQIFGNTERISSDICYRNVGCYYDILRFHLLRLIILVATNLKKCLFLVQCRSYCTLTILSLPKAVDEIDLIRILYILLWR